MERGHCRVVHPDHLATPVERAFSSITSVCGNVAPESTLVFLVQAWLVCPDANGNKDVYVNLGPYDYDTPAGCADETIHAYTGPYATA